MTLLKIAWRSIWRSKTRSSVVILAIASGLLGGLFSSAWMNGMAGQRVKNTFDYETGHLQIHHPEYSENFDVRKTVDDLGALKNSLRSKEGVLAVTHRVKANGMAATANKNLGVNIVGVDPEEESRVFRLAQKIDSSSGGFFIEEKKNSIVISKALAEEMKVRLKSKIVLTFQDFNGEITGAAFRVVGIFRTDNNPWDKSHVFVLNRDLKKVLELPDDRAHEVVLRMEDYETAPDLAVALSLEHPQLLVEDWSEISPYLRMMSGYMDTMMGIFIVIILAALGFGIVNTMLMVVLERTRELGMLMAIGMTKKRVFMMIMLETILLALVGGILGELISMLAIWHFGKVGIDLSSVADGLEAVGYSSVSYPMLEAYRYMQITVLVILTGVIASIYPAIKALRLHPAEAIRAN